MKKLNKQTSEVLDSSNRTQSTASKFIELLTNPYMSAASEIALEKPLRNIESQLLKVSGRTKSQKPKPVEMTRDEVIQAKSRKSLRKVICPIELIDAFKNASASNTNNLIETCGILAGYEDSENNFVVNTLIIPS